MTRKAARRSSFKLLPSDLGTHFNNIMPKTEFLSVDGKWATSPGQAIHLQVANTILTSKIGILLSSCGFRSASVILIPTACIRHLRTTWLSILHLIT